MKTSAILLLVSSSFNRLHLCSANGQTKHSHLFMKCRDDTPKSRVPQTPLEHQKICMVGGTEDHHSGRPGVKAPGPSYLDLGCQAHVLAIAVGNQSQRGSLTVKVALKGARALACIAVGPNLDILGL